MKLNARVGAETATAIELGRESVDRQGENHSDDAGHERERLKTPQGTMS